MKKKQIFYTILTTCMASSAAFAGSPNSGPLQLTPAQMDRVTAGVDASGIAAAVANGGYLASTKTTTYAATSLSNRDNPGLGSVVGVATGEATAVAVGPGSATGTATDTSVNTDTPASTTFTINLYQKGPIGEISGSGTLKVGSNTGGLLY